MTAYQHPLVTDEELEALAGRERPCAQRRWLEENGIAYFLNRDGRPRTTWGAVDAALLGADSQARSPNLDAVT